MIDGFVAPLGEFSRPVIPFPLFLILIHCALVVSLNWGIRQ